MVAELMILAGRVAAKFAYDRTIALPFRIQEPPNFDMQQVDDSEVLPSTLPNLSAKDATNKRAIWDAVRAQVNLQTGELSTTYYDEVRYMMNPALMSATPRPHGSLGIADEFGYSRVTSPIRRYVDMLIHWQLKAALTTNSVISRQKTGTPAARFVPPGAGGTHDK